METKILLELDKDPKLHEYLINHSAWYVYLNRDSSNFTNFKKEYKEFKRNTTINKVDKTVENIELLTNVMKIV